MPDLSAQVGAGRRVSWRVAALAAVLRTKLRLPLAQRHWRLAQSWAVRLSIRELNGLMAEAARAARPADEALVAEARASPMLPVDETGWREDGRTGWIWTLATPTVRYFRFATSRAGEVVRALVGAEYEGVVVSDVSPLVVARKISGGTRSKHGSRTRMVLQSLVATWELRGRDPVAELAALLRAPRTPSPDLALV